MFPSSDHELQDAADQLRRLDRNSPDVAELCRHILELCGIAVLRGRNIESEITQVADFSASCVDVYSGDVARFQNQVSQWELRYSRIFDLERQRPEAESGQVDAPDIAGWQDEAEEFETMDACADIVFTRARLELIKIGLTKLLGTNDCGQEQELIANAANQVMDEVDTQLTTELNLRRLSRIMGLPLISNLRNLVNWSEDGTGSGWWIDRTLEQASEKEDVWFRRSRQLLQGLQYDLVALPLETDQSGQLGCPAMEDVKLSMSGDGIVLNGDRFHYIVLGIGVVDNVNRAVQKLQWTVETPQKSRLAGKPIQAAQDHPVVTMAAASSIAAAKADVPRNWTLSITTDWVNLLHDFDYETSVLHLAAEAKYKIGFDWDVHHNKGAQHGQAWSSRTQAADFPFRTEFSTDIPQGADRLTITLTEAVEHEVLPAHLVDVSNFVSVHDDGRTRLPISLTARFDPGCENPSLRHLQDPKSQLTLLCFRRSDVESKLQDDEFEQYAAGLAIQHSRTIRASLQAMGAKLQDSEDAFQTALMECLRQVRQIGVDKARSGLPSTQDERAFLSDLARKRWIDLLRRKKRWNEYLDRRKVQDDTDDVDTSSAIKRELASDALEELQLSEDDRTLLFLRFVEGYSLQEIAEIRDVAAANIRQRMSRLYGRVGQELLVAAPDVLSDTSRQFLQRALTKRNSEHQHAEWLRGLELSNEARESESPEDQLAWEELGEPQRNKWIVEWKSRLSRAIRLLQYARSSRD